MTRIYIAGPMTGLPENNYPAFNAVAKDLRALGYEVENPAENPACETWEGYMRLSLRQIALCDEVYFLRGWANSRGATFERKVAQELGLILSGASA